MDDKEQLVRRIQVANKQKQADLVIKGGKIVNVFTLEVEQADVAIVDGKIVGVGTYSGLEEVDAKGKYVIPGLIDGHVHIESSMVPPDQFAEVVLPHGVTTVVTDPHEIANVAGEKGIQFMLDNSEGIGLDALFMLPSCVPATPFEHSGATLSSGNIEPFYSEQRVLGLAEVMDYPSVANTDKGMIDKIQAARSRNRVIDGHGAGLDDHAMNVYRTAGILTDHEATTKEEAYERLRKGLYVLIREGSGSKDLASIIPLVNEKNSRRFLFCTDDKHLDELIEKGSIDENIRLAIKQGLDPLVAIQLATLNAAECYRLTTKGAVAPGYEADFLLIDDLQSFSIESVYKAGEKVAQDGKVSRTESTRNRPPTYLLNTMNVPEISKDMLQIPLNEAGKAYAIKIIPNSLVTEKVIVNASQREGEFISSVENDLLKIAVIERHHRTGHIGLGIIKGLGISEGAIALTVAHDSHNLVVAGTNDDDIIDAIEQVKEMRGGMTLVKNGEVIASVKLDIAGLMSSEGVAKTYSRLKELDVGLEKLGFTGDYNPFSTLSFMCLPVIPELKLTDLGYFDCVLGIHIPVEL